MAKARTQKKRHSTQGGSSYFEKLKDPRWQKIRLKILERDNWTCQNCGDKESTLNVHHRYYKPKLEPWEYPEESLITLCEECHEFEKMLRPGTEALLLKACKEKLLCPDVESLAIGIHHTPVFHKLTIDAFMWCLQNSKEHKIILKKYKSHISIRKKVK